MKWHLLLPGKSRLLYNLHTRLPCVGLLRLSNCWTRGESFQGRSCGYQQEDPVPSSTQPWHHRRALSRSSFLSSLLSSGVFPSRLSYHSSMPADPMQIWLLRFEMWQLVFFQLIVVGIVGHALRKLYSELQPSGRWDLLQGPNHHDTRWEIKVGGTQEASLH